MNQICSRLIQLSTPPGPSVFFPPPRRLSTVGMRILGENRNKQVDSGGAPTVGSEHLLRRPTAGTDEATMQLFCMKCGCECERFFSRISKQALEYSVMLV